MDSNTTSSSISQVAGERGSDWTADEVYQTVRDYFDMLQSELLGLKYNKAANCRELMIKLPARSARAIESKHRNISAAMIEAGLPYIRGYKPLFHFQRSQLPAAIARFLIESPQFFEAIMKKEEQSADLWPPASTLFEVSPPAMHIPPPATSARWPLCGRKVIDFVARDAANRQLGRAGEESVLRFERSRLMSTGRDDLAAKVEWIAETYGSCAGFDILSFDERTGSEQLIEVKTTNQGPSFPFYLTANELDFSRTNPQSYRLIRIFDFSLIPKFFVLQGSLDELCSLTPTQYRATFQC